MQLSNSPVKIPLPFAASGLKNTIPEASQIGIVAGAASLTDGFPPLTRTPLASGGIPVAPGDMNGILFELSAIVRWANAGGGYAFDGTFAADSNVGGYPKGARVMRSDGLGYWFNTTENNTTDPEGTGAVAAGWVPDFTTGATTITMTGSNVTLTALQYGKPIVIISGLLTTNLNLIFPTITGYWVVINNTTGAFTITCKTTAGTGVTVATTLQIVGDGTNIYAANGVNSVQASIQGAFKNLAASATGLSANVTVSADEIVVESIANAYQTLRAVSLTIAGTSVGANGLDTGAIAINTWYSLWVVFNGTTTAGLMSLSATVPTMPSGYTHKARVGWIRTDASGNKFPLSFKQYGREVQYALVAGSNVTAYPTMASGTTSGVMTAIGVGTFLPPTAAAIKGSYVSTVADQRVAISPNNVGQMYEFTTASVGNGYGQSMFNFLLESTNIYWSETTSGAGSIRAHGWTDNI